MDARKLPRPTIDCVDFSCPMIAQARHQLEKRNINARCIEADIRALPLPDGSYDTVCLAYGIRNIPDQKAALTEAARLLRPKGRLFILELTPPPSAFFRFLHSAYLKTIVPVVGGLLTCHIKPYTYLRKSIETFSVPDLMNTLQECGFACQRPVPLTFGTATIIEAQKP
jgi:demethylmenaquinone methyltransferase/2-methoxy-6-polyprenyl-1,4-benzoquinol methylase